MEDPADNKYNHFTMWFVMSYTCSIFVIFAGDPDLLDAVIYWLMH